MIEGIARYAAQEIDLGVPGVALVRHALDQQFQVFWIATGVGRAQQTPLIARTLVGVDALAYLAQRAPQLLLVAPLHRHLRHGDHQGSQHAKNGQRDEHLDQREAWPAYGRRAGGHHFAGGATGTGWPDDSGKGATGNGAGWPEDSGSGIPWKGNYSTWLEHKQARLKQEESTESARQKALQKELEWSRQNPKARQAKSKARLARFNELSEHEYQKRNETQEIFIPVAERLGNDVIEFKNVSKAFGDRLLIDNLSFTVPPGAIVGIIGPNGAGKSTLFKMITGKEQPDSGEVVIGKTARVSIVDQNRDSLADNKSVFEDVSGGADMLTVGRFEMPSRAYLGRFNFMGSDQQKQVGNLSGGERGRLHLAKTLLMGGNVLLLDEPSNDLDVETLRALEDALLEFAGSVMVISHDRWFLDRIATHILAFEGNSQVTFFDGNYQEYEADKKKRLGEEGAKPKRIRYKPLTT